MPYWIGAIFLAVGLFLPFSAKAHEFWLSATPFSPRVGSQVQLRIYFGEYFEGTQAGFQTTHSAMLKHYFAGSVEDLIGLVPAGPAIGQVPVSINRPGLHLIAFDSFPAQITLAADKFEAYLHDEGLDRIVAQRRATGKAAEPGRERYRRNTKTLIGAGGANDRIWAMRTGQRLELVPLDDPLARQPGAQLRFKLFFDGKPLSGALLRAWHHQGEQTVSIRVLTDDDGQVRLSLPYAGVWMISTVHMIPAIDSPEADWDSFWGSLMFEAPGAG